MKAFPTYYMYISEVDCTAGSSPSMPPFFPRKYGKTPGLFARRKGKGKEGDPKQTAENARGE